MAPKLNLDPWQKQILQTKGNICLCSGRQVGKSTVISIDAGEFAVRNPRKEIMIISAVERQAYLLFEKVLDYIATNYKSYIKTGKERPTKQILRLKNGSIIRCLPTGLTGYGIRGHTIHRLYADEAAFIPDEVWTAVTPMLATTGGDIVLLSTPYGRQGYFYRAFQDPNFTTFEINTEEIAKGRQDPQRQRMLDFLEQEKTRMTRREYAQEYLGQFIDETDQYFPDDLIKKAMILKRPVLNSFERVYLGVDMAGKGEDETTYEILGRSEDKFYHMESIISSTPMTTIATREILELDKTYKFKEILIDAGGIGQGTYDQLIEEERTRRKTTSIINQKKSLKHDDSQTRRILKEDLYANLLTLLEQGRIKLLDDPEIFQSLRSVQFSYEDGKFKIFGRYTHIAEGLIRAAWPGHRKINKLWIRGKF